MFKKGQSGLTVTIFIIIALIIVMTAVVWQTSRSKSLDTTDEFIESLDVPRTLNDQVDFIMSDCLRQLSLEALDLVSHQGGYVSIPPGIDFEIIDGYQVPYWDLIENPLPELNDTLIGINGYIEDRIDQCMGDFSQFHGYTIERGIKTIESEAGIHFIVRMKYPMTFISEEATHDFEDFIVTIPINLQKLFDVSYRLYYGEYFLSFLEVHSLSMLSNYMSLEEDALPPMFYTDAGINCTFTTWDKDYVEAYATEILKDGYRYLRVGPSMNAHMGDEPYVYELFLEPEENVNINISIDKNVSFDFDIDPEFGGLLQPFRFGSSLIKQLPTLCLLRYEFKYDLDFPSIIEITDFDSANIIENKYFEKEGYRFQYLINTKIVNNHIKEEPTIVSELTEFYDDIEDTLDDYSDMGCTEYATKPYSFVVLDKNGKPLDNARIFFHYDGLNCYSGSTDQGYTQVFLPDVTRLNITIEQEEYASINIEFNMTAVEKIGIILTDQKLMLDVNVKKIDFVDYVQNRPMSGFLKSFEPGDMAIIKLGYNGNEEVYVYPETTKIPLIRGQNYSCEISFVGDLTINPPDSDPINGLMQRGRLPMINFTTHFIEEGQTLKLAVFDKFYGMDEVDAGDMMKRIIYDDRLVYKPFLITYEVPYSNFGNQLRPVTE